MPFRVRLAENLAGVYFVDLELTPECDFSYTCPRGVKIGLLRAPVASSDEEKTGGAGERPGSQALDVVLANVFLRYG